MSIKITSFRSLLHIAMMSLTLIFFTQVAAANVQDPRSMLESVSKELLGALKSDQAELHAQPQKMFDIVDQVLAPHVDLETMSRWVLGKNWRTATPEQRARFTAEFRTLMVRFYVSALLDDPKQIDTILAHSDTIIVFPPTSGAIDPKRTIVRSEVHVPSGPVVPVIFNLHEKNGEWLIFDVNVDGISLVTNYRNSFGAQVAQNGLETLIDELAAKNKALLEQAGKSKVK